jgi:hypothetical protein
MATSYNSYNLDHLGLIAGMKNESVYKQMLTNEYKALLNRDTGKFQASCRGTPFRK